MQTTKGLIMSLHPSVAYWLIQGHNVLNNLFSNAVNHAEFTLAGCDTVWTRR
jgi:hypothetical protein